MLAGSLILFALQSPIPQIQQNDTLHIKPFPIKNVYLSLTCCVTCILSTIISIPLDLHSFVSNIPQSYSLSHAIICGVIQCYIFYLLSSRFYMLFFDINWTIITLSSHWLIHIPKLASKDMEHARLSEAQHTTPDYTVMTATLPARFNTNIDTDVTQNWFIKHKSKYGSIKNIKKLTRIFFGVASVVYVSISVLIFAHNQHLKTCTFNYFMAVSHRFSIFVNTIWCNNLFMEKNTIQYQYDQFFFYQEMHINYSLLL